MSQTVTAPLVLTLLQMNSTITRFARSKRGQRCLYLPLVSWMLCWSLYAFGGGWAAAWAQPNGENDAFHPKGQWRAGMAPLVREKTLRYVLEERYRLLPFPRLLVVLKPTVCTDKVALHQLVQAAALSSWNTQMRLAPASKCELPNITYHSPWNKK